ncbi:MAG: hypothetical protein H7335_14445 [Massilia sp.]|nr:hypothetical protein [Massilia sp.]
MIKPVRFEQIEEILGATASFRHRTPEPPQRGQLMISTEQPAPAPCWHLRSIRAQRSGVQ